MANLGGNAYVGALNSVARRHFKKVKRRKKLKTAPPKGEVKGQAGVSDGADPMTGPA